MEWSDDEFEAFLRRFRPRKPKPLPTHRRTVVALAIAAVMVLAAAIPMRFWSAGPGDSDSTQQSPSAPFGTADSADKPGQGGRDEDGGATPAGGPSLNPIRRDAENKSPTATASTTASPLRWAKPPDSPLSNGPTSAMSGVANRRLRVGGAVRPPRKLVDVTPVYPEDAQEAGIEGYVILDIVIGEDGSVIEAGVIHSIPALDRAAIEAVTQWEFEPTLLNGEPVEIEMNVTVNFTLR
jgi:TonB family protein